MHKSLILLLALGAAVPATAAAPMPLHQFVARGTALEKKGPLALLSRGEIRLLHAEMTAAGNQLREERLATAKAGRKGPYCPPANSSGGLRMAPQELLKELRVISAGQPRTATVADGIRALLAKRYPCPA